MENNLLRLEGETLGAVLQSLGEAIVQRDYGRGRLIELCDSLEEQNKKLRAELGELKRRNDCSCEPCEETRVD